MVAVQLCSILQEPVKKKEWVGVSQWQTIKLCTISVNVWRTLSSPHAHLLIQIIYIIPIPPPWHRGFLVDELIDYYYILHAMSTSHRHAQRHTQTHLKEQHVACSFSFRFPSLWTWIHHNDCTGNTGWSPRTCGQSLLLSFCCRSNLLFLSGLPSKLRMLCNELQEYE